MATPRRRFSSQSGWASPLPSLPITSVSWAAGDYVFDMALSSAEGRLATIAYDVGSGTGETIITVYDIGSSNSAKKLSEHAIDGEFPLSCAYLENGELAVVTNRSVRKMI